MNTLLFRNRCGGRPRKQGTSTHQNRVPAALVLVALALGLAACSQSPPPFDENAYYRSRMEQLNRERDARRSAKEADLQAYNRRVVTTDTLILQPPGEDGQWVCPAGCQTAGCPHYALYYHDPYDSVQGKSRTGTESRRTVKLLPDGSVEETIRTEAIYRDRIAPTTVYPENVHPKP